MHITILSTIQIKQKQKIKKKKTYNINVQLRDTFMHFGKNTCFLYVYGFLFLIFFFFLQKKVSNTINNM